MISVLTGKVLSNNGVELVVMTAGGVGYKIAASPSVASSALMGSDVTIETYLVVKEDALELYGFGTSAEKELFKNCLSVSGIGPKSALNILKLGSVEEITLAIARGDLTYLTKVSGVGKKTAERLVVELRGKAAKGLSEEELVKPAGVLGDVVEALMTLGYSAEQAREVAKVLKPEGKTSEQLLREALQIMK
jgi:Holliday junction DNA helicase RuvA